MGRVAGARGEVAGESGGAETNESACARVSQAQIQSPDRMALEKNMGGRPAAPTRKMQFDYSHTGNTDAPTLISRWVLKGATHAAVLSQFEVCVRPRRFQSDSWRHGAAGLIMFARGVRAYL